MTDDREHAALQAAWGPLSRRAINVLERGGVTPERLRTLTDRQLRRIRGMGPLTFREIREAHPAPSAGAPPAAAPRPR